MKYRNDKKGNTFCQILALSGNDRLAAHPTCLNQGEIVSCVCWLGNFLPKVRFGPRYWKFSLSCFSLYITGSQTKFYDSCLWMKLKLIPSCLFLRGISDYYVFILIDMNFTIVEISSGTNWILHYEIATQNLQTKQFKTLLFVLQRPHNLLRFKYFFNCKTHNFPITAQTQF